MVLIWKLALFSDLKFVLHRVMEIKHQKLQGVRVPKERLAGCLEEVRKLRYILFEENDT